MATITDTTTEANGNIIINVSSSADDAITLATAGTYSDKNIIFNITTPAVDFPEQVQSDWEQNDDSSKDYIKNRPFYSNEILQDEVELTLTDGKGTKDIHFDNLESSMSSTVRDVYIVMKRNGEIIFDLTGTAEFIGYPVSSWMSASLKGTCSMYPSRTVSCEWSTGNWSFKIDGADMSNLDGIYTVYCYSMDIKQISDTFIPDTIARTSDMPIKLPNPNALAFTGAVTGSYDGSKPLTVNVPSLTVDDTLTKSGQAGDAKATGDAIRSLSDEIVTTAESKVSEHNSGTDTHSDIRLLIQGLTDRLNVLADSDDTTLDQLSEVVAYIKSNRSLIEAITTSKVSVADIVDDLTTNVTNKPLSAAQGVVIKTLIDALRNDKLDAAELTNAINTALAQAKASGEFDGADGKSAYQYAQDGGYTGTETEFAAKLAEEMPDKLPNPNALTFTGAVAGSYDGSAPLEVEIPSGGGASGDYIPIPPSAEVGQTIVVKAVDEKGKPTAWEAVTPETWNFVMADGTKVTKKVYVYANE